MTKHGFKKGEYEDAVEHAKELLGRGRGITEIMETTNLTQEDINKLQSEARDEVYDRK